WTSKSESTLLSGCTLFLGRFSGNNCRVGIERVAHYGEGNRFHGIDPTGCWRACLLPGPSPLYRPCFPVEFLIEARPLYRRRTAKAHLRQRARLVALLHEQPGASNAAAASRVGLPPNPARLWRQRWAKGRFDLEDQPG